MWGRGQVNNGKCAGTAAVVCVGCGNRSRSRNRMILVSSPRYDTFIVAITTFSRRTYRRLQEYVGRCVHKECSIFHKRARCLLL